MLVRDDALQLLQRNSVRSSNCHVVSEKNKIRVDNGIHKIRVKIYRVRGNLTALNESARASGRRLRISKTSLCQLLMYYNGTNCYGLKIHLLYIIIAYHHVPLLI